MFLVTGRVSARKNVGQVRAAVASSSAVEAEASALLVVAGKVSDDVLDELSPGPDLLVRNAYLTDLELDAYLRATDVLVLAYTNTGSSGLLNRAAREQLKVVLGGADEAQDMARRSGAIPCALEVSSLRTALDQARVSERGRVVAPATDCSEAAFAGHLLGAR